MGKGDKKSRRGKIYKGSYGVRRPKKRKKSVLKKTVNKETKE
jgi:30S ribosomal protein S31